MLSFRDLVISAGYGFPEGISEVNNDFPFSSVTEWLSLENKKITKYHNTTRNVD